MLASVAFFVMALLILGTGCGKKAAPAPPPPAEKVETPAPPPPPPAPTVTLRVSPTAIEKGQSATLTWDAAHATEVTIDNGVGTVAASGSRSISPSVSTTYVAKAAGAGGSAVAEARITVTAPPAVAPPPAPVISDAAFFEANIKDVFFDLDEYTIRADAKEVLDANVRALNERPGIRITIEGHCDERGSEKYNLVLGDKRANAVRDYLVSQGISASRIDTISYGEERNFCEESTEECWQLNRRGHLIMR